MSNKYQLVYWVGLGIHSAAETNTTGVRSRSADVSGCRVGDPLVQEMLLHRMCCHLLYVIVQTQPRFNLFLNHAFKFLFKPVNFAPNAQHTTQHTFIENLLATGSKTRRTLPDLDCLSYKTKLSYLVFTCGYWTHQLGQLVCFHYNTIFLVKKLFKCSGKMKIQILPCASRLGP